MFLYLQSIAGIQKVRGGESCLVSVAKTRDANVELPLQGHDPTLVANMVHSRLSGRHQQYGFSFFVQRTLFFRTRRCRADQPTPTTLLIRHRHILVPAAPTP